MAQIIFKSKVYRLTKPVMTVGFGSGADIVLDSTANDKTGIFFSVSQSGAAFEILCAQKNALKLNGKPVARAAQLMSGDRLEWQTGACVFIDTVLPLSEKTEALNTSQCLGLLQNLAVSLQGARHLDECFLQALKAIIELGHAEGGHLLTETGTEGAWGLVASHGNDPSAKASKRALFSNTILSSAIQKRAPVYVESIVGHPWADVASVMDAKVFSVACLPLILGERIFGAVYLYTCTPGRSICKDALGDLSIVAAQVALMLASKYEVSTVLSENAKLKRMVPPVKTGIVYNSALPSPPMREIEEKIAKLAPTPLSVLILGETGTGKELIARELHDRSGRAAKPLVAINCAAIPATLLESTLFGFEKGAFTGATRAQIGKFSQADGGTLFLDEIGDLDLDLQAKLLRAIQEKTIEPLGANQSISIDVRIVCATHQPLDQLVREKKFRQDLYYRLNGASILLPPLRDRIQDIEILAIHFLKKHGFTDRTLSQGAIAKLREYSWPGNVRELEQAVLRAAYLSQGQQIDAQDIALDAVDAFLAPLEALAENLFFNGDLKSAQENFTKAYLEKVLSTQNGNRLNAARQLGISERTLYRILSANTDSP